jgi:uncharacterized protein
MTTTPHCPPDWQHDVYSCPRWLRLLGAVGRGPAFETTTLTARLPIHTSTPTRNRRYALEHLLRGLDIEQHPSWFAGPMSGYRTDPLRREPGIGTASLDGTVREAAERAAQKGHGLVVPYLPRAAVPSPDAGGVLLFAEIEYWLRPAASFDEYVAPFSNHRRTALRHELRAFEASGARAAVVPLADHVESFAALTVANSARRGELEDLAAMTSFLGAMADAMGSDAVLLAAFLDDRFTGGVLGLRHGRVLSLRMTGFDDAALEGSFAYFVLTYYAPTLLRHELVIEDVHLGVGAGEAKRRRGARAEPLFTWARLTRRPERDALRRTSYVQVGEGAAGWTWPYSWQPMAKAGVRA